MSSNVPVAFNLTLPTLPGAVYSFLDEDRDWSVGWSPHPGLLPSHRQRLVEAVRKLSRHHLISPVKGELFKTLQEAVLETILLQRDFWSWEDRV
jgi:hypothetical protein